MQKHLFDKETLKCDSKSGYFVISTALLLHGCYKYGALPVVLGLLMPLFFKT